LDEISLDLPVMPGADLLQRVTLFKTLSFTETIALSEITHVEKRAEGATILEQDSLGSALFIIKEGKAAVRRRELVSGEAREVAVLREGELFGEMSLIEDQLVSADVVALTPVELLVLPRKEFEGLLTRNPALAVKIYRAFCRSLSDKLRKANVRVAEATNDAGDHAKALGFPKGRR
jgi:CRP/FNR family cyclic AMP-dependent transcriptional regulator